MRAFVTVQLAEQESTIEHFNLFVAAKRRTFTEDADDDVHSSTLGEQGLTADVLLVQDLDA